MAGALSYRHDTAAVAITGPSWRPITTAEWAEANPEGHWPVENRIWDSPTIHMPPRISRPHW